MNISKLASLSLPLLAAAVMSVAVLHSSAQALSGPVAAPSVEAGDAPVAVDMHVGKPDGTLLPGQTAAVPITVTHTGTIPAQVRIRAEVDDTALSRAVTTALVAGDCPDGTTVDSADATVPLGDTVSDWAPSQPGQSSRWCVLLHLPDAADVAGSTMELVWHADAVQD